MSTRTRWTARPPPSRRCASCATAHALAGEEPALGGARPHRHHALAAQDLLHSNQIAELPASICLLVALENLDVHKNMITSLPPSMGNLKALRSSTSPRTGSSELPISICELNENLQLAVGRNPLEKPSIEQARQGIGSIRRFFGWSRKRERRNVGIPQGRARRCPTRAGREGGAPAVGPSGEGAKPARLGPARGHHPALQLRRMHVAGGRRQPATSRASGSFGREVRRRCPRFANFNLQKVGRVRESKKTGEGFAERVEFIDQWLPARTQDVGASEHPKMVIQVRWTVSGVGAERVDRHCRGSAYGVSVGARASSSTSNGEFATVVRIRDDDVCDLIWTTPPTSATTTINPGRLRVDVRPDASSRVLVPVVQGAAEAAAAARRRACRRYRRGIWLGLRRGSRHRVRIGGTKAAAGAKGGKAADGSAGAHIVAKRVSVADGKHGTAGGKQVKETIEVDEDETNHTKLLFPTVAKYEDAKSLYCERIIAKYATFRDDASAKDFKVIDSVFVRPSPKLVAPVEADKEEDANKMGDANGGGDRDGNNRDGNDRDGSPASSASAHRRLARAWAPAVDALAPIGPRAVIAP